MRHATDSFSALSRKQVLGTRESKILTRWAGLDAFLLRLGERLDAFGGSGADPPTSSSSISAARIVEITEELLASAVEDVNRQGLWFLVMTYLDARQEPRCWYGLADDEVSCLSWMFPRGDDHNEDDELLPKELVALYLCERAGMAPDWFQPMPEA